MNKDKNLVIEIDNMNDNDGRGKLKNKISFCGDKEEYIKYLRGDRIWENGLYIDPDTTHQLGRESKFYQWVEEYLNTMEENCFNKKWKYTLIGPSKGNNVPSGIMVKEDEKTVMYLRSDQLGFSAPQGLNKDRAWDKKYTYGKYINSTNDFDRAANIIWDSRSQGGFFIWPIIKFESDKRIIWKSQYNTLRGVGSYIEDRADITLWEIKMFYVFLERLNKSGDGNVNVKTIINQMNKAGFVLFSGSDKYLIFEWLIHFKSFSKYVCFFSFESFLKTNTENIINIINGETITEKYIADIKKCRINRIVAIDDSSIIKGLLERLQCQINYRTDKMVKRIKA